MAKDSRFRRMTPEDFAAFCASATVNEIQDAFKAGVEWDARAFISAAASNTDPRVIWLILKQAREAGINIINARSKESRQTALHWAAGHNDNPDITRALIAGGANVNLKDNYGVTPLGEAEAVLRVGWKEGRQEVIEMLKKAGAR